MQEKKLTNCDLSVVCSRRRFTYRCGSEAVAAECFFSSFIIERFRPGVCCVVQATLNSGRAPV